MTCFLLVLISCSCHAWKANKKNRGNHATEYGNIAATIMFAGALLAAVEADAQSMPKDVAARVDIYGGPSLTITDH